MADQQAAAKRAAGRAAADLVRDGQRVGLGTGSTVAFVLERLAERIAQGIRVAGVPTSERTAARARELGIPLASLDDLERLDIAIDGADEVDPAGNLVKGGGAALTREKIVAAAADRLVIVVSPDKLVPHLGASFRLPIEVLPFGWRQAAARVRALGLGPELRLGPDRQPVRTDGGNLVLDASFGPVADLAALERALDAIPGVVECGLFVAMAPRVLIGELDGRVRELDFSASSTKES
ncbi:MAG: ribose-5-phosphate isomerase RpiA [Planctomycetes bacterium]|nr:ribose-5-phosphate isomerase RpiA [Planctomycetota bacterium]